jgi:hypothetical protein
LPEEPQKKFNVNIRLNIYHYDNNVFLALMGIDQTPVYIWSLVFFACFYLIIKVAYISSK